VDDEEESQSTSTDEPSISLSPQRVADEQEICDESGCIVINIDDDESPAWDSENFIVVGEDEDNSGQQDNLVTVTDPCIELINLTDDDEIVEESEEEQEEEEEEIDDAGEPLPDLPPGE
jgi:hypothetical protein